MQYMTKGRTSIERNLLKWHSFIQKITRNGKLQGYRLYGKGCFGLPAFRGYYWL